MKSKKAILITLIIALGAISISGLTQLRESKKATAALQPDNLVIIPIYNRISTRAENGKTWIVTPEYDIRFATFAVFPAGKSPYKWSVDDPTIMELSQTPEGFLVNGTVKKAGQTTLKVEDSSGLKGELRIKTELAPEPPEPSQPATSPQPIKEIPVQVQVQISPVPSEQQSATAVAPIPTVTQVGWKGPEVTVIQDFLKAEGSFTYPQSTGYFGTITRDAVKTFQKKYSLPSTGVVDKPTLEKMKAVEKPQVSPGQRPATSIKDLMPVGQ